jgi:hypothetical protein
VNLPAAPSGSSPRKFRWLPVWSFAWGLLAVLHVTQAIWLSGGQAYPGDLGDGRFNQLLLEHGYQALRGQSTWASPGQFYPVRDTLAYSDTHAGTLPIYAVIRRLSVSREEAWQFWFIAVTALNALAAYRLFRALGIADWLRGPVVFATVGSTTMVWLAGTHMQMLPVFPALLAWEQAVRWHGDRCRWRLVAAAGWSAWQFAAGPYTAFFAAVIAGLTGLARCALGQPSDKEPVTSGRWRPWLGAWLVLVAGGSLAAAVLGLYFSAIQSGHTRGMVEIVDLAPTLASWFTAAPVNGLYPAGWPGGQKNLVEHAWFTGFLPWLLLALALASGWSRRRTTTGAWTLALGLGTVATVLFFTKWSLDGSGPWVWLAGQLEPLRAFRASGRVAGLLQFTLIGAGALLLTHWLTTARTRLVAAGIITVAVLLAAENFSRHQPATLAATARARAAAVVAAWRQAGDRPILAFAPGYSNQPDAWVHLDAWSAALALRRVTINGYSGGLPASHVSFAWNPTAANARALLAEIPLPPDQVSLVESLGLVAERQLGFTRLASRPLVALADFSLQPAGWTLFAPLETYEVAGRPMYQFTPPAEIRFSLPIWARRLGLDVRMRTGSYDGAGHSDGVGLTWLLRLADGTERTLRHEEINPRDRPADRGTLRREVTLPPGAGRTLLLRIDAGPHGNPAWDWPLFGALRVD